MILSQARDDYIKLMHPKRRRKRHLAIAWVSAISCIFDNDYLAAALSNEWDKPMSLEDLAKAATDRENVDIEHFRAETRRAAKDYWSEYKLKTIDIPKNITVCSYVYSVETLYQHDDPGYCVDYDLQHITILGIGVDDIEQAFCQAVAEIIAYHTEIRISKKARMQLTDEWYETLRVNNCFNGD